MKVLSDLLIVLSVNIDSFAIGRPSHEPLEELLWGWNCLRVLGHFGRIREADRSRYRLRVRE